MADQSAFSFEERMVTITRVQERHNTGDTLNTISVKLKERFQKNPPTRKTTSKWESKLLETGNAKNASRSERPMKRLESCESLEESMTNSSSKSTRKRSAELDISRTTMMPHMKKDLEIKAWPYYLRQWTYICHITYVFITFIYFY